LTGFWKHPLIRIAAVRKRQIVTLDKRSDMPIRILIVDDSAMYRRIVQDVVSEIEDAEVVGVAENGRKAMAAIAKYKPDMIVLDIDMPEMDGMAVLEALGRDRLPVVPILYSAHTIDGAQITVEALQKGAFDFITKPSSGTLDDNRRLLHAHLSDILEAVRRIQRIRINTERRFFPPKPRPRAAFTNAIKARVIGIGVSTGGPQALLQIVPKFPQTLHVPVLIVQHMPALFTSVMAQKLDSVSPLHVKEAEDSEPLLPGNVYIAQGGKHMRIEPSPHAGRGLLIRITDDPPENNCKPSADYLFRSLAEHFGGQVTGVIMTGMGADGVEGLKRLKQLGATVLAQDEASCAVFGMPKKAIESGIVDVVAPIETLAAEILKTVV
jgi:two-component system chemotaxis response regulator CheB